MSKTNLLSIFRYSIYGLLPLVAVNVFLSLGLREAMIELPVAPQTENTFRTDADDAATCHFSKALATTAFAWPDRILAYFVDFTTPGIREISVRVILRSTKCFYGKAVPEALDD